MQREVSMVISYNGLVKLCESNVIEGVEPSSINGSSVELFLGEDLLVEDFPDFICPTCGSNNIRTYISTKRLWDAYLSSESLHCETCIRSSNARRWVKPVDFSQKESIKFRKVSCAGEGYVLQPGQCCLAHTVEKFNLPMHITAEYRLKSSMARIFLEHLHAAWCDPGWNSSVLTLEFVNMSQYHPLLLKAGTKCGQATFYEHEPVPEEKSYKVRGQYNGQSTATETRGVK